MRISTNKILFIMFFPLILLAFNAPLYASERGRDLPEELRQLNIKEQFIESQFKEVGTIREITGKGKLVVVRRAKKDAYYAKKGDPVYENDALYTMRDCRTRLEFKDKNTIIMAPDSHLDIEEVYESLLKGKKKALFGMKKGKAIFYAIRLFRYPEMIFQLKTSTATIGIRGTKFGAEIEKTQKRRSHIMDRMLASRSLLLAQASAEQQNIITRVYGIEGEVYVASLIDGRVQRIRENEILEADLKGLGVVKFDPERTKAFIEEVVSGMVSMPRLEPRMLDKDFRREELDRMEQMEDIKQEERIDHDRIFDRHGGGN